MWNKGSYPDAIHTAAHRFPRITSLSSKQTALSRMVASAVAQSPDFLNFLSFSWKLSKFFMNNFLAEKRWSLGIDS
jgi:hypothetical protein